MTNSFYEYEIKPLLVEDPLPAINWLKQQGLLRKELKCSQCEVVMNWTKRSCIQDKYLWKCQVKDCSKYKYTESIRKDSFLFRSRISLQKWIEAIYYWVEETNVSNAANLLNISKVTVIDIYKFFREICNKYFERNPIKLGGTGIIVQMDAACFSHKQKHKGCATPNSVWVFGIVDSSTKPPLGYMEIVDSCSNETLLPIIKKVVLQGTIIHNDQCSVYVDRESDLCCLHEKVDHHFILGDKTNKHTQVIESYLNKHNLKIKSMLGSKREFWHSYLQEFMWRERNTDDAFLNFCSTIASEYPFH